MERTTDISSGPHTHKVSVQYCSVYLQHSTTDSILFQLAAVAAAYRGFGWMLALPPVSPLRSEELGGHVVQQPAVAV